MIQYWKHNITGEIYAVDVVDHEVTNAYGPIQDTPSSKEKAKKLDFNFDNSFDVDWLRNYQDDFSTIEMDD